jgi:hypothetical protein
LAAAQGKTLSVLRLVQVAVQQRQELQDQAQLQQLAAQDMTHQHLEAKLLEPLITQAADQVAARQAVELQQAQQRAEQTVQLTQGQAAAETRQQGQTIPARVGRAYY